MNLPFFIAGRYLFARKSHNVINRISAISAIGMAVGTAALIIILSIYNGFDALVKSMVSSIEPDLAIVSAGGKFFIPEGEVYDWLYDNPSVKTMSTSLQDNVFVEYEGAQGTAVLKGVDSVFMTDSPVSDHITDGEFVLEKGEIRYAAVGQGFARQMGINVHFTSPIRLYYPDKDVRYSAANPMSSVNVARVWPSCEFSVNADIDSRLVIVSQDVARSLLGLEDEVSSVELRFADGLGRRAARQLRRETQERLGDGFKVLDRMQQNPTLYKMLRYEKLTVYLIMVFIVLILGFSIFGSLSMLIIEKEDDIATLRALGADSSLVNRIFVLEGWFISLSGMIVGLILGIVFCILQQKYGFIKMPGTYVVDAYPVVLNWLDVVISAVCIAAMGYVIALLPARRLKAGLEGE